MKILITTDWYSNAINGVVTSVKNLIQGLFELGHDVRILTLSEKPRSYSEGNVSYIASLDASGIYPNARLRIAFNCKEINDLIKWKPDIIHSQCELSTFTAARHISKQTGTPIVHTYHTIYEDYTHYFSPSIKLGKQCVKVITRYVTSQCAAVIAPSDKVRTILENYGCTIPIRVIPTGLNLDRIVSRASPAEREALKQSCGIAHDEKVVLYAGRLAEEKNISEIISFFATVSPQNAKLLIVGGGPAEEKLKSEVVQSGISSQVVFTGMVSPDKICDYYSIGDVFVSASQSETQGLTYIEAMANGVPLLCRRDPCLANILIDSQTGFSYTNFSEFSSRLDYLLTADTASLRLAAADLIRSNYSLQAFAQKAVMTYLECIGTGERENE